MFIVPVSRRAAARARHLDRLFDGAFDQFFAPAEDDAAPARRPAIDVAESDAAYTVTLDVPGLTREDVKVSIDGRHVSVVAEASAPQAAAAGTPPAEASAEAEAARPAERVILRERAGARYARGFTLQSEIDQAASQARLDNGVLTLTLTKRQPSASRLTVN